MVNSMKWNRAMTTIQPNDPTFDYLITAVFNHGAHWGGKTVKKELYIKSTSDELRSFLTILNKSSDVVQFTVERTIAVPVLTRLVKVSAADLNLKEDALEKFKR